ncbi:MAG: NAD-dependent epimerase/dehydratase family protein [Thermoplasmata archaeon]|nr:NAD-dependent epimerase/dehydratase family protein [Thermoplasmata archaeon]
MKSFVTGGAGFIGSHLVDRLIQDGGEVTVFDNLCSGKPEFMAEHENNPKFEFVQGDLLDLELLKNTIKNYDQVFHIAANPDIRLGTEVTDTDLKQGTIATYNVLEAMRLNNVKNIAFSSSSTVYGEASVIPTPEDYGPLVPISLYGAAKLASEALITAYANTFDMNGWIFRFANIIGDRGTHGILVDFINKLRKSPQELEILGDGTQSKSYLLVQECVDAILFAVNNSREKVNIFNLGSTDQISVTRIAELVVEELGLEDVKFKYTGGKRGWRGDIPQMMLAIAKVNEVGWQPKSSSEDAIRASIKSLLQTM